MYSPSFRTSLQFSRTAFLAMLLAATLPAHAARPNYDSGDPSADEQVVLEFINRARMDPVAEGVRLGININEGLSTNAVARPPLAMNKILLGTARAHSQDMWTRRFFAHTNPDGKDPFDRIDGAGYLGSSEGENIAASSSSSAANLEDLLMRDTNYPGRGHRVNLLDVGSSSIFREIGIGYYVGATPIPDGLVVKGLKDFITQDFGRKATGPFIVGVVYNDANQNGFYDLGEGLAGVRIVADSGVFTFDALTGTAGGYVLPIGAGAGSPVTVTASGPGFATPKQATIALTGENVKLDFTPSGPQNVPPVVDSLAALKGPVTGESPDTSYAAIGAPQTGAFAGTMMNGRVKTAAIFAADGSVRVKLTDPAPGLVGSAITKFAEPGGDLVRATLKTGAGGVTSADNEVLLGGLANGPLAVVARKNQELTGLPGVRIKKILKYDGNGPDYFLLAQLQGTDVKATNDYALCVAPGDGSVRVVMREDQAVGTTKIKSIGAFLTYPGTVAEGRWRASAHAFGVRVTLADKGQQLFTVPATATTSADWLPWVALNSTINGATVRTLGNPGFGADGPAAVVTMKSGATPVDTAHDTWLVRSDLAGNTVLATEGGPVPDENGTAISGAKFKTFGTPVSGAGKSTAFAATIAGVTGTSGLWIADDGVNLRQLARAGSPAPGGGKWAKFTQLALADGAAPTPYFLGTLASDRAAGVSAANNAGLWSVDATGKTVLLLRTGRPVSVGGTSRMLKSFVALTASPDSLGAAHGYDDVGHIVVKATFTDKTVALLRITVP